ncbi:MAG: cytochrome c family protein [Azospirillaceae bacterium]|nr:cytochrome c family protein [Azospirillaceae bacterium]
MGLAARAARRRVLPSLALLALLATLPAAAQTPDKGERLAIRCRTCHEFAADKPHKVGPNLHGLFGRKAGQEPDFHYSKALPASGIVWDDATLDAWLTRPATLVPGTTMAFPGMPDKADRDALIAWLHQATR